LNNSPLSAKANPAPSQALLAEYTSLKAEQTSRIGFRDNMLL